MSASASLVGGGFSLLELLVSTAIMMVVTGAIFSLVNPSHGTARRSPVSDLQQRMRVGSDALFKELMMAGAGPYFGAGPDRCSTSSRRSCHGGWDCWMRTTRKVYKSDTLTLTYIPNSHAPDEHLAGDAAAIGGAGDLSAQLPGAQGPVRVRDRDDGAHLRQYRPLRHVHAHPGAGRCRPRAASRPGPHYSYVAGSTITQAVSNTYYRNAATNQLMVADGGRPRPRSSTTSWTSASSISAILRHRGRPIRAWPAGRTASTAMHTWWARDADRG